MADAEKTKLQKLGRLYEALRENQAKSYALLEEIGELLAGGVGIGDKLKQLEAAWSLVWEARYGSPYLWTYVKDRPQLKRLAKGIGVDELIARFTNYLRDEDQFYVSRRHPFALFVTNVNRYAEAGHALTQDELLDAPGDCAHTPRCRSEQEHTRRNAAELRR